MLVSDLTAAAIGHVAARVAGRRRGRGERPVARLDLLVAEPRDALGLRRMTPRELAEFTLERAAGHRTRAIRD